ncbi:MAG: hypothetical protein H3C34_13950 [Caldilineaceae bacterium]|nr:hypothetical protein [Caldilineaceae bacterium]
MDTWQGERKERVGLKSRTLDFYRWLDLERRPAWFGLLLFMALGAIFYAPIILGLRTFPDGDFTHHFLPFSIFFQSELLSGHLPLWNPYTYGGHPFLADVQAAVFYPVSSLFLALTLPWRDAGARLYWLELEAIGHVALAGYFTYLLASRLTGRRTAGVLAGITFAFSGYLTGYPPVQLAVLRTAIWLPLILLALLRGVEEPGRWRWWIVAGLASAVAFLAGHAQTFLFLAYTVVAWTVTLIVSRWRGRPGVRYAGLHLGIGLALAFAIAVGLSAAQLLASVEYAGLSVRANVDYAYVSGGFPLQDTWQALIPGVLTTYSPLYVGAVGLGLAWLSWGEWWVPYDDGRKPAEGRQMPALISRRGSIIFFAALALAALLLSYGDNGFLYPLFYRLAPGWQLFRGQERTAYLVAFGASMLAGHGTALITRISPRQRAWMATVYGGLVVAAVYLFGLLWQLPNRTAVGQWHYLGLATVTVSLAAAFAVMLRLPGWSRRRTLLLAVLAFANLLWANAGTNSDRFDPARKAILPPEVEALQSAVAATGGGNAGLPGRVYNEFRVYEDYSMRAGVEDVWGASPLRLSRYARLFDEFPLDRMWRLMGVDHVLTWRRELFEASTLLAEFPQSKDTTYLHRLAERNPRAWIVANVRAVSDDEAVELLAGHQFDLETTALLPENALLPSAVPAVTEPGLVAEIRLAQLAPGHLRVTVTSPAPALLLLAENWMPGWRVRNIQCPADLPRCAEGGTQALGLPLLAPVRANLTQIGVPVPAGKVSFELLYWPASVQVGLWISGLTLVGLLGAGVVTLLRRRARHGD